MPRRRTADPRGDCSSHRETPCRSNSAPDAAHRNGGDGSRRRREPLRQRVPAQRRAGPPAARDRDAGRGRDAAARRGAGARRHPDAQPRDVRHDVDGARGAAGDRREPAPQLHRPRRVPADGGDRAALHPDARRPVPRARGDDRHAHAGLVGGDHARRAVAEVEVARAARGGRASRPTGRTSCSAATCTWCGRSSAATSTSSRGSSRCRATSSRSGPRTSSRTSTRTRSGSPPCSARRSPATPTTSSASTRCCGACATSAASRCRCTSTAPAAASCGRSCTRTRRGTSGSRRVRSINVSGHKYGLVYPGLGWLIFRERSDLPEDLVFYENYLGKRDMTFTLNFSTGSSMVLAQYYNFVRYGHEGYRYIMETMQPNARALADGDRRASATSSWSGTRAPSSSRSSPSSSPRSATSTSSTSPPSSPPSAAGCCRPTRCRRTPST